MVILERNQTNPYFNIAAEEFVLKYLEEDSFTLWRNEPAIIVGRHQNTVAEINQEYVDQHAIPVVRRMTGGGAVFHDLGNICFTFVRDFEGKSRPDFSVFTRPIIDVLQQLGVNARFEGRNDLTIEGHKFSGNANGVWKNRILHHGTLLFKSNVTDLAQSLKVNPIKFEGKSVKSVSSRITNISEHLAQQMEVVDFIKIIEKQMRNLYPKAAYRTFTDKEVLEIEQLADQKYKTREWNYGQSPKYSFNKGIHTERGGNIELHCSVENGRISEIKIFGDYFFIKDTAEFETLMKGCLMEKNELMLKFKELCWQDYFANVSEKELASLFL